MIEQLLCAPCLAAEDATVTFTAVFKNYDILIGPAVGAQRIIDWYESLDLVALRHIEYATSARMLIPVAIWQGTPVCEPHLYHAKRGLRF